MEAINQERSPEVSFQTEAPNGAPWPPDGALVGRHTRSPIPHALCRGLAGKLVLVPEGSGSGCQGVLSAEGAVAAETLALKQSWRPPKLQGRASCWSPSQTGQAVVWGECQESCAEKPRMGAPVGAGPLSSRPPWFSATRRTGRLGHVSGSSRPLPCTGASQDSLAPRSSR